MDGFEGLVYKSIRDSRGNTKAHKKWRIKDNFKL